MRTLFSSLGGWPKKTHKNEPIVIHFIVTLLSLKNRARWVSILQKIQIVLIAYKNGLLPWELDNFPEVEYLS